MSDLLKRLKAGEVLVCDGAMGTFLQAKGLEPGECPEEWNMTHRAEVREVAEAYSKAGSDLVETNSFGGTSFKLKHFDLAEKISEINRLASEIAREGAGPDCMVAASVGPTGQFVEPLGEVSEQEMFDAFAGQVTALAEGGAHAICVETMSDLNEAGIAVRAAKQNTELPVIATFTFDKQPDGSFRTMMGVSPEQVVSQMTEAGADVIGSNCGNGIENMIEIAQVMRENTDKFLMFQANAGMPVLENGQTVFKATPEEMAGKVNDLLEAGASIIGGCCGTTPEHIRQMAEVIRSR